MSDPVTNIEIEDVLSSIRRLVSDEARANERGKKELSFSSDVPPQAVELEEENDVAGSDNPETSLKMVAPALVLTPALRIEPETAHADTQSDDEDLPDDAPQDESAPALILTQDDSAEESTEENKEDFSENFTDDHSEESRETSLEQQSDDRSDQSDAEGAEHSVHTMDHMGLAPREEYAAPAEPVAHEMDDAPQDQADLTAPAEEMAYTFHADDALDTDANDEEQSDAQDSDEPLTIEDKIAALEALISGSDSDFEPDGAETGGNAGRPGQSLPWEESQETRVNAQSSALPDPEEMSQTAVFSDGAAAFQRAHLEAVETAQAELQANTADTLLENDSVSSVLDEEALRDMVADIVRQELQGPLGERITRNVRKLVRREIYRALAANELD